MNSVVGSERALKFHIEREWKQLIQESDYLASAIDLSKKNDLPAIHPHLDAIVLMGMSSAVEKCYSGMERIVKILAENLDDYIPKGDSWHKSLIEQMASKVGDREPVLSENTAQLLQALRHRERNSYSFDLDKTRVLELGKDVFLAMASLKKDLMMRLFAETQVDGGSTPPQSGSSFFP
jgi:hypothetical protein